MKKIFMTQKIFSIVYIVCIIFSFIYSLYFMTDYAGLRGFARPANQELIDLYAGLQSFNFMIYWFAIIGLVSIIFFFALEVFKKVCDRLALIVINLFAGISIVGSALVFVKIPSLMSMYSSETLLENAYDEQLSSWTHELSFTPMYLSFALYGLFAVVAIGVIASTIITHKKFVAQMEVN